KAFANLPYCQVLSIELKRQGPSYAIDTVKQLRREVVGKNDELFLLLGQDQLAEFSRWKQAKELLTLARPLVACRSGYKMPSSNSQLQKALKKGMTNTPCFDISATEIRKRLKERLYCNHLLDKSVLTYIHRQKLYE